MAGKNTKVETPIEENEVVVTPVKSAPKKEERVDYLIEFETQDPNEEETEFCSLNFKNYRITKGENVKIPKPLKVSLESNKQERRKARAYEKAKAEQFTKALKDIGLMI